jgi:hypothetical protein
LRRSSDLLRDKGCSKILDPRGLLAIPVFGGDLTPSLAQLFVP